MNYRFIEAFHWSAALGSFAAAAEKLHTTQSAISARIRELESSLGVSLFERTGTRISLTASGRALVPLATDMLRLSATIKSTIPNRNALSGLLRIGVGDTIAMTWFPRLLARLGEMHPLVEVEVYVDFATNLNKMLLNGYLDLAFLADATSPRLLSRNLGRTAFRWVSAASFHTHDPLDAKQLANERIITFPVGSHLHGRVANWFEKQGFAPRYLHCNSVAVMIGLTRAGCGVSILPIVVLRELLERKELMLLDMPSSIDDCEFFAARNRENSDPAVLAVMDLATQTTDFDPVRSG